MCDDDLLSSLFLHPVFLLISLQEQINNLVNLVSCKAMKSSAESCNGSSPNKTPTKRRPRKSASLELTLTRLGKNATVVVS